MKHLLTLIAVVLGALMVIVWVGSERARPVFLSAPAVAPAAAEGSRWSK